MDTYMDISQTQISSLEHTKMDVLKRYMYFEDTGVSPQSKPPMHTCVGQEPYVHTKLGPKTSSKTKYTHVSHGTGNAGYAMPCSGAYMDIRQNQISASRTYQHGWATNLLIQMHKQ